MFIKLLTKTYGELDMTVGAIEAARRGRGEGPLVP